MIWVDKWIQPIVYQGTLMKTIHLLSDSMAELILEFFFPLGSDALAKPLIVTGFCFFVEEYNGISLVCQEKKGYEQGNTKWREGVESFRTIAQIGFEIGILKKLIA